MIYMMWSMHANIILHRPAAESPLSIVLVGGVNDTAEDAAELSALVHGMNCHINLIP